MPNIIEKLTSMFDRRSSLQKAVDWIKNHRVPNDGILAHHKTKDVTPEVTGYIIKSLYDVGEKELAFDLSSWEASIQKPDGAFAAPGSTVSYTFDTAQVMRGFLAVVGEKPVFKQNLARAADFMVSQIQADGRMTTPDDSIWTLPDGTKFSEYCYLYAIAPLKQTGQLLGEQKYINAAQKTLNYYKSKNDITDFKPELGTLSHIFGYMMEGLAELGELDLAKKGLAQAFALQAGDGSIPAYPSVSWVCSTGVAQLGIAAYIVGEKDRARRMLEYLETIQNKSGGFFGSYGAGSKFFPHEEISWGDKFFIDLHLLVRGKNG
ncbi:MAG: terpene cyclase/mutase family protein [Candidatus Omnitrophica bacterium]|nr:terpene cyclase/mutase family protein [Candidatus Omnitrophota bacterium]